MKKLLYILVTCSITYGSTSSTEILDTISNYHGTLSVRDKTSNAAPNSNESNIIGNYHPLRDCLIREISDGNDDDSSTRYYIYYDYDNEYLWAVTSQNENRWNEDKNKNEYRSVFNLHRIEQGGLVVNSIDANTSEWGDISSTAQWWNLGLATRLNDIIICPMGENLLTIDLSKADEIINGYASSTNSQIVKISKLELDGKLYKPRGWWDPIPKANKNGKCAIELEEHSSQPLLVDGAKKFGIFDDSGTLIKICSYPIINSSGQYFSTSKDYETPYCFIEDYLYVGGSLSYNLDDHSKTESAAVIRKININDNTYEDRVVLDNENDLETIISIFPYFDGILVLGRQESYRSTLIKDALFYSKIDLFCQPKFTKYVDYERSPISSWDSYYVGYNDEFGYLLFPTASQGESLLPFINNQGDIEFWASTIDYQFRPFITGKNNTLLISNSSTQSLYKFSFTGNTD